MRILHVVLPFLFVVALCGCRSNVPSDLPDLSPCTISVTRDGAPLEGATIVLYPNPRTSEKSWTPMGVTDASGSVSLKTNALYDGAPLGKYKIVVSKIEQEQSKLGPAPPEDDPKYVEWVEKSTNEGLSEFNLVEPTFSDPNKTTLEIEVVKGANSQTVDVGKAVRTKM